jgi:flagellar motor switch protein FliM
MDQESERRPDEAATDQLLRELPVEVVCELGRVTMTGRELLEMGPGAVIPVGRPLAGPVDLTVGGRVVARGELVDVEGEVGVRIIQLCE